jgi:hypothetical protein
MSSNVDFVIPTSCEMTLENAGNGKHPIGATSRQGGACGPHPPGVFHSSLEMRGHANLTCRGGDSVHLN